MDGLVPVLTGSKADCSWTVLAGFDPDGALTTAIRRSREGYKKEGYSRESESGQIWMSGQGI
jgi:hypothetical protein